MRIRWWEEQQPGLGFDPPLLSFRPFLLCETVGHRTLQAAVLKGDKCGCSVEMSVYMSGPALS